VYQFEDIVSFVVFKRLGEQAAQCSGLHKNRITGAVETEASGVPKASMESKPKRELRQSRGSGWTEVRDEGLVVGGVCCSSTTTRRELSASNDPLSVELEYTLRPELSRITMHIKVTNITSLLLQNVLITYLLYHLTLSIVRQWARPTSEPKPSIITYISRFLSPQIWPRAPSTSEPKTSITAYIPLFMSLKLH